MEIPKSNSKAIATIRKGIMISGALAIASLVGFVNFPTTLKNGKPQIMRCLKYENKQYKKTKTISTLLITEDCHCYVNGKEVTIINPDLVRYDEDGFEVWQYGEIYHTKNVDGTKSKGPFGNWVMSGVFEPSPETLVASRYTK